MAFLKEFKEFALKGNVMDMAVGVIIGGAFGKIVSSLVNDILMPPIGALIGNTDFSQLRLDISKVRDVTSNAMHSVGDMVTGGGDPAQAAAAAEPIYWNYGAFIQQCVDFTILALCVFLMVKLMNRLMKKKEEAPAPEAQPRSLDERREAVLRAIEGLDMAGIVDVVSLPLNIAIAKFRLVAVLTLRDTAVATEDKGVLHEV